MHDWLESLLAGGPGGSDEKTTLGFSRALMNMPHRKISTDRLKFLGRLSRNGRKVVDE